MIHTVRQAPPEVDPEDVSRQCLTLARNGRGHMGIRMESSSDVVSKKGDLRV